MKENNDLSTWRQAWQHPHLSLNLKGANGEALVGRTRALAGNIKSVFFLLTLILAHVLTLGYKEQFGS